MKILHTADWQLGKPYARIEDPDKRALARRARLETLERLGEVVVGHGVALVLVAGDVFDATTVDRATVSNACRALGRLAVPVLLLPGNHDHGGPGTLWHQEFWQAEQAKLAPNVTVALEARRYDLAGAAVFACPLLRRSDPSDATAWLRDGEALAGAPPGWPRIVLAHGATQTFGAGEADDEDGHASNLIEPARLPEADYDYLALGDWHGTKQVGPKAWYAGAHEQDRFPKGEGYASGNVLVAEVGRGAAPQVLVQPVGRLAWRREALTLHGEASLEGLEARLEGWLGGEVDRHLLHLTLEGSLGLADTSRLEALLETLAARLVRLRLHNRLTLQPGPEELAALTRRATDPTIQAVASKLVDLLDLPGEDGEVARVALRELHRLATNRQEA